MLNFGNGLVVENAVVFLLFFSSIVYLAKPSFVDTLALVKKLVSNLLGPALIK